MRLDNAYNFIFHPMTQPTCVMKTASVLTIVALTVLTGGAFLLALGIVSLRDRKINPQTQMASSTQVFQNIHPNNHTPRPQTPLNPTTSTSTSIANNVGTPKVQNLKLRHAEQLKDFEEWASAGKWDNFAHAHYDWWMFPIMRTSQGHGDTYAFSKSEIEMLKSDAHFMRSYRRGVELVLKSWGWNIESNGKVANPTPEQKWVGYGVRLGKMGESLGLFSETELFNKAQKFYTTVCVPHSTLESWIQKIFTQKL